MANREYFLGIDGGGSKTTAVVFDENGNFICSACGESINYYSVGLENARLAMTEIINSLSVKEYTCAFIGMSALNERASAAETERFCSGVIKSELTVMDSDLFVALEAMNAQGECACIISGTGSMVVRRISLLFPLLLSLHCGQLPMVSWRLLEVSIQFMESKKKEITL